MAFGGVSLRDIYTPRRYPIFLFQRNRWSAVKRIVAAIVKSDQIFEYLSKKTMEEAALRIHPLATVNDKWIPVTPIDALEPQGKICHGLSCIFVLKV